MTKPNTEKEDDKQQRGGGDAGQRYEQQRKGREQHRQGQGNRQSDQDGSEKR